MGVHSDALWSEGATQTCQRGLDEVLRDCKDCVDIYVDDCIIFSDDMASHVTDEILLGSNPLSQWLTDLQDTELVD